jgi:group I intron endonuclease
MPETSITPEPKSYGIIYCFTNKVNGKEYIGQTKRLLAQRIKDHVLASRRKCRCRLVGRALAKYGISGFVVSILDSAADQVSLDLLERQYIVQRNTLSPYGYNLKDGGQAGFGGHFSEETKKRISESLSGRVRSEEHKQHLSDALRGRPLSEAQKAWHASRRGIPTFIRPELREKMRIASCKPKSVPHWSIGLTKDTDERIRKRSLAMIGLPKSADHRLHLSLSKLGKPRPEVSESNRKRAGIKSSTSMEWLITTPEKQTLRIVGLAEFCRQKMLSFGCMSVVAKRIAHGQKTNGHRGFLCEKLWRRSSGA